MQIYVNSFELKPSPIKGIGVFSKVTLPGEAVIFEFTGRLIRKSEVSKPPPVDFSSYKQITADSYLSTSGAYCDYFNHSCNANCYLDIVGTRAFLITLHQINPGDEITWDYSTTCNETKEEWSLSCNCGAFACRKIISGFQYLDDKKKKEYIGLNIVPDYIVKGN